MKVQLSKSTTVFCRKLEVSDFQNLAEYLAYLSEETKSRFEPHPFDLASIIAFYEDLSNQAFIALNEGKIVAYSILKSGFLPKDAVRLTGLGLVLNNAENCTFAPSVADAWQGIGLAKALFDYMMNAIKNQGFSRMILWGGVQTSNEKAIRFYQKQGFKTIGAFENKTANLDMIWAIGTY
jgi:diamine N-acetyltransferase